MLRSLLLASVVLGCSAARPQVSLLQLTAKPTGRTLLAYLSQQHATAEVCDARVSNGLLGQPDAQHALVDGALEGVITADDFGRCVALGLATLEPSEAAALLDVLVPAYERLLGDDALERSPDRQLRLQALHDALVDRPTGLAANEGLVMPRLNRLAGLLERGALGPVASRTARELLVAAELERGLWKAQPVTSAVLDTLRSAREERTLQWASRRLPDAALRREAARHVVALKLSPPGSTRPVEDDDELIEAVLQYGHNVVDVRADPVAQLWVTPKALWPSHLSIEQRDVGAQRLFVDTGALLPSLELSGLVWAKLTSGRVVTVCRAFTRLDPTPCLSTSDVHVDSPWVRPLGEGHLQLVDTPSLTLTTGLAAQPALQVPIRVAAHVTSLDLPVRFVTGAPLVFEAAELGAAGPSVDVAVTQLASRLLFVVRSEGAQHVRVVEADELGRFSIASMGARGRSGIDGDAGLAGVDGAACQAGSAGGPGAQGGPGGAGGDGGRVSVELSCSAPGGCDATLARLAAIVRSEGGTGGFGGSGGRGGAGGSGGPARSSDDTFGACASGASGERGRDGDDGAAGPAGNPGPVTVRSNALHSRAASLVSAWH